jgi:glucose-1-phosphate cytidylyltransferase
MNVVILCGGLGTRLREETEYKPKPMVEIGSYPILWHIMKIYSFHGVRDFIICCGYRGYLIKEYFANYFLHMSDVTIDMSRNHMEVHQQYAEPWRVTLVDTGESTQTGGRLKRVAGYLAGEDVFCFTYGDGLADIDIGAQLAFHGSHGRLATVMAVRPPARYGALAVKGDRVTGFAEKPAGEGGRINGGFFVLSAKVMDYLEGDQTSWEDEPLKRLAREGELMSFHHEGFWQPMDTLREKNLLEDLWLSGRAPWKKWS